MLYVISYDVVDDNARRHVHELLKDFGRRVQFSVFECDLKAEEVQEVARRIEFEIDGATDSCRLYRLCQGCRQEVKIIGKGDQYSEPEVIIV
jgi:CRISPR-associated protein Cas2